VSLGCPEYTLEEGPRWDGFDDARYELRVDFRRRGHCILWRRLIPAQSMVDLRALKSRNFSLGCFFSFITGIGIFATTYQGENPTQIASFAALADRCQRTASQV
jgi:MFS transporter, DHA2 family, multidrug resistance protein